MVITGWPVVITGWPVVITGWPVVITGWSVVITGWPVIIFIINGPWVTPISTCPTVTGVALGPLENLKNYTYFRNEIYAVFVGRHIWVTFQIS